MIHDIYDVIHNMIQYYTIQYFYCPECPLTWILIVLLSAHHKYTLKMTSNTRNTRIRLQNAQINDKIYIYIVKTTC
jgi:hypothetical protein